MGYEQRNGRGHDPAFDALGDPTRRAIFDRLRNGPRAVADLAEGLPVSRPAVSKHLRVLAEAGLVTYESRGTRNLYRIDRRGVAEVRRYLDQMWDAALARFAEAAESQYKEDDLP